ncbi:MAG: bifunctional glutamate N-acetyltransferase/amino-acid acetyltransferase ArgJ [Gammaproteobacteria bacterium]|nr:bifunctional glutamate N-acetyltransferase/amino-acid acetyltransferase ArgJ [Gammaproteobacteria bacterium]
MAVNLAAPERLLPVAGVRLGVARAAIKEPCPAAPAAAAADPARPAGATAPAADRDDLLLIELAAGSQVAGQFTQNAFAAAPVLLCRQRLCAGVAVRGLLVNAGNANAATGDQGLVDAGATTAAAAHSLGVPADTVLPLSTGVIGRRLPVARMLAAIPRAAMALRQDAWLPAARAMMTTDTVPKGASRRLELGRRRLTVTGIAKGVGMICPDMATLLAFIATDAPLTLAATQRILRRAVAGSFNCATVDGDTSTNDACLLAATGTAGGTPIDVDGAGFTELAAAIEAVCVELAQAIVRDGEGATRFVTLRVEGAADGAEARRVAYAIARSPLVKTALFAGDANWGRLIMAIGNAGVAGLDPRRVDLWLDQVALLSAGQPDPGYREELGAAVVARPEFTIRVALGRGGAAARIWTCDFSYDYVRINAEYRS